MSEQPRVPAGSPEGGRWTAGHGGAGTPSGARPRGRSSAEYPPRNAGGRDTRERFSDGRGNYTPERAALHDEIVAKYLLGTTPVRYPTATIVGGGPAAGKSSLAGALPPENTVRVDVDEVRKELPEYREQVGKNRAVAALTHEEASDVARKISRVAAENSRNVLLDGTGDGTIEKLVERVATLRAHDYRVDAKYVVVEPDVAVARMEERGRRTGRYVPEDVVRDTHAGISRVLPRAIWAGAFDAVEVYDNSAPDSKPRLILRGERGARPEVIDGDRWEAFLRRGE